MNIPKKTRCRERGQATIEFAFVMPLLVLILMGVFDLGGGVYAYNVVSSAAREGARYGTFKPGSIMACTYPFVTDFCQYTVANTAGLDPTQISIKAQCLDKDTGLATNWCYKRNLLEVTVTYQFRPFTLLFSPLTLMSKSKMMIEIPP